MKFAAILCLILAVAPALAVPAPRLGKGSTSSTPETEPLIPKPAPEPASPPSTPQRPANPASTPQRQENPPAYPSAEHPPAASPSVHATPSGEPTPEATPSGDPSVSVAKPLVTLPFNPSFNLPIGVPSILPFNPPQASTVTATPPSAATPASNGTPAPGAPAVTPAVLKPQWI